MFDKKIIIPDGMTCKVEGNKIIISSWNPREGEYCYEVYMGTNGIIYCRGINFSDGYLDKFHNGLITKSYCKALSLCNKINIKLKSL